MTRKIGGVADVCKLRYCISFAVIFLSCFLIQVVLIADANAAKEAVIEHFSPQGEIRGVRQVAVRFSEEISAFGDPRIVDPFQIGCSVPGKGRWVDGQSWVYDFDKNLSAGIRCSFTLKDTVKTRKGQKITGQKNFSFTTGGPRIILSYPQKGSEDISEDQIFLLKLDGDYREESILRHVSCFIDATKERVGVRILKGAERDALMKGISGERYRSAAAGENTEHTDKGVSDIYRNIVFLQCKRLFPGSSEIHLVWGAGVESKSGITSPDDQALHFKTREPLKISMNCSRERKNGGCIPLLPVHLNFSAFVSKKYAEKITAKSDQKLYKPRIIEEGNDFVQSVTFEGPFPEKTSFIIDVPRDLKDDAGRSPENIASFPLKVRMEEYPPLARFSSRFGIIEKVDPYLPVTVRNIEPVIKGGIRNVPGEKDIADKIISTGSETLNKISGFVGKAAPDAGKKIESMLSAKMMAVNGDEEIIKWLHILAGAKRDVSILEHDRKTKELTIPRPQGKEAFEVIGVPLDKPGFYVIELKSAILGTALLEKKAPLYVPAGALMTNLSAHLKWGRESSIVWVTTLDKALPVADASVTVRDVHGKIIWQGKTDKSGIARLGKILSYSPPSLKKPLRTYDPEKPDFDGPDLLALNNMDSGYFVFVRTADDMAFVHSSWNRGIEPYRFKVPQYYDEDPIIVHTIFDRKLLRAGDTLHMKHIIRKKIMEGIVAADKNLPEKVIIRHMGSDQKYVLPLKWDTATGNAENAWTIPKEAKLGSYSVALSRGREYHSGTFRVEEFKVPLMKGRIHTLEKPFIAPSAIDLDLSAEYLTGGGARDLPVKLRSQILPKRVSFTDYDGFVVCNGSVREGVMKRGEMEYTGFENEIEEQEIEERRDDQSMIPAVRDLVLGKGGTLRTSIDDIPVLDSPKDLHLEMEYRDPNGEIQTISRNVPLWPSDLLVGIETNDFSSGKEKLRFKMAAFSTSGKPLKDVEVEADLFSKRYYSHRKRLIGGFYAYEHVTEIKKVLSKVCQGRTDKEGFVFCELSVPVSGDLIIQASAANKTGTKTWANSEVWISGEDEWWGETGSSDRIDLIPDKKRYEPGETAVFQVKMPMREATVLVAVEREGVIDAFATRVSGKNPVIKVPIKNNYGPNIFVSAFCVRGRIGGIKPTAFVDLGKPSFKIGITGISVGCKAHELKVRIDPDREVYKTRGKARFSIKVATATGRALPANVDVAFAVVDDGLLELMTNTSWNLLESMMGERGYAVSTSTAQMQVVGKRHYGLKAVPRGGGGGKQITRELFDTLLLWRANIPLNDKGEAVVEVPLNDSLTSFTAVAIATAGDDLFGTGKTKIRTTQDLMIFSGLPEMVREGDSFRAVFTVRNTTSNKMDTTLTAHLKEGKTARALPPVRVSLTPGESKEIGWNVTIPAGVGTIMWDVTAESNAQDNGYDGIKVVQKIKPAVPVRVFQATMAQIEKPVEMSVAIPADAIPGRGGVRLSLMPRLAGDASGIVEYMSVYPYTCMEQKVSRAVALQDEALWKSIVDAMPSYLDGDGLLKYFPLMGEGSDILTSYVLAIAHETEWKIPEQTRTTMLQGLQRFVEGKIQRKEPLPDARLTERRLAAIEALSRYDRAKPAYTGLVSIQPNLWPTSAVIDWLNILMRVKDMADKKKRLKEAEQIIRSRLNFQGTHMGYSTEKTDYLWWLMVNGDVNSIRTVLTFLGEPRWKADMPRLVRGMIERQKEGRWFTTTANAWGRVGLKKFSDTFEALPVSGMEKIALGNVQESLDWGKYPNGRTILFDWPAKKERLHIHHEGKGKPWATIQSLAAIPVKEPLSSGYKIKKIVKALERKNTGRWSVGDTIRVRLELEAQSDMTWVVVNDPVPAGVTILGRGLEKESQILTTGETGRGWAWPAFEERSFEAFRAYYRYVPKGKWSVEYTMRLNTAGRFVLPGTRVEALYAPEMFSEIPNGPFEIN